MMSLVTELDVMRAAAAAVREHRILLNWRQTDLAQRSGVAIATIQRFEKSGVITLAGFAKLSVTLGFADDLLALLKRRPAQVAVSVEQFAGTTTRKRVQAPRRPRKAQ